VGHWPKGCCFGPKGAINFFEHLEVDITSSEWIKSGTEVDITSSECIKSGTEVDITSSECIKCGIGIALNDYTSSI